MLDKSRTEISKLILNYTWCLLTDLLQSTILIPNLNCSMEQSVAISQQKHRTQWKWTADRCNILTRSRIDSSTPAAELRSWLGSEMDPCSWQSLSQRTHSPECQTPSQPDHSQTTFNSLWLAGMWHVTENEADLCYQDGVDLCKAWMLLSVMRTENKGLLALFSVRQGRWVYLFSEMTLYCIGWGVKLYSLTHSLDRLGFSVTCTVHSGQ